MLIVHFQHPLGLGGPLSAAQLAHGESETDVDGGIASFVSRSGRTSHDTTRAHSELTKTALLTMDLARRSPIPIELDSHVV